ncbi:protoheme IX farnesyltransferase [Parvularcula maris]|uniref:Protoheme IX farnesyltransferase n=1 Tax=Parvularcula maris TaxID=2965077 RepID=A0A9X2L708_9PROT|nr:protoheme IX farnesyltransferase [Parvularcula maris]MCQ8184221.1 protoheme IX farnesyltransferase [Parvularcula maris]
MDKDERSLDLAEAREGLPTGELHQPTEAEIKARDKRNIAIALAVVAFIALVFATTMLRLSQNLPQGGAS